MKPTVTFKDGKFYIRNLGDFVARAEKFTEDWYPTIAEQYANRGQSNEHVIKGQRTQATLSEFAVQILMEDLGFRCTKAVDLKIYQARDKRFDSDLVFDNKFTVNVKSQTLETASNLPLSWILQYGGNGTGHIDPIFRNKSESKFLVLCCIREDAGELLVEVSAMPRITRLTSKENFDTFIQEPAKKHLIGSKRAIYYKTLTENLLDEDLWALLTHAKTNRHVKWA